MLYKPATNLKSKRGYFGIVTTNGPSGPVMRRLSFPVQPGSSSQVNWRHTFVNVKQNWQALAPGGTGYIPVNGVDPQSAWAIQASSYFGILQPGLITNGVQAMGILVGCATPEAYYTMVQTNRASLGLSPLPAPELVNQYLALENANYNLPIDNWDVLLWGPATVDPDDPSIEITVYFYQKPLPLAPTNFQASATGLACVTTQPSNDFDYLEGQSSPVTAAVANGSAITYTVVSNPYGNDIVGWLFSCTGFTPAAFNCTLAPITAASGNNITIASATPPASASTLGTATFYPVAGYSYSALIDVSPTAATAAGAITLNFSFDDANGTQNGSITVNASPGNTQVAQPCPTFAFPNSMSCSTLYDNDYNVIGFLLTYTWYGSLIYPMARDQVALTGIWETTASPSYTDSYSPPDASTWSPILFSGPNLPDATDVLAAWIAVNGPLPPSGNIKFQLQYLDPNTGSSGPSLSATASWQTGTLKGANLTSYTGHYYQVVNTNPGQFDASYAGITITATINAVNGYAGTIAFTGQNTYKLPTGTPPGTTALPPGTTITFDPPSLTITPGDTSYHPIAATFVLPSTTPPYLLHLKLQTTDGIQTSSAGNIFQLTDGSGELIDFNFLSIDLATSNPAVASPGAIAPTLTLNNTGPSDFNPTMAAACTNPALLIEFGSFASVPATATANTLVFAIATGAPTNSLLGQTLTSAGYSPNGFNVTDAAIIANDASTITVTTAANPGPMTTQGIAGLPNPAVDVPAGDMTSPGSATIQMLVSVPASTDTDGIQIQIQAQAGANSTTSGVTLTGDLYGSLTMTPLTAGTNSIVPGTYPFPFNLANASNAAFTVNITLLNVPSTITASLSSNAIPIAAGSTDTPATASFTLTITIPTGYTTLGKVILVQANGGGFTRQSFLDIA